MVEYGNGVSSGAGSFSGSHGGSKAVDAGGNIGTMFGGLVHDTSTTIATLPPVVVALGAAILVIGLLLVLRKVL